MKLYLVILVFMVLITPYTSIHGFTMHDYAASFYPLKTYYLHVKSGGWIENLGDKPVPINETDLLVFDYPLNISTQKVLGVKAYVDNTTMNYTVQIGENSATLIIVNETLEKQLITPGERISAWVEYNVSVDMSERLKPVWSLLEGFIKGKKTSELIEMSGSWNDIWNNVKDQKYYKNTKLWNQSNPLIKLLVKYLNETISGKPFAYILEAINWIDTNIVYSTRIPPRQPWEVIVEGAGDCDDKSNLLITLLRANHIPSYLEIGLLYLSKDFKYENTEVNGLIHYRFIGGGGHGWVVAYIPPWGWVRMDLTASAAPGIGRITTAAYYLKPIIIMSRIYGKDYASESAKFTEELKVKKLKYDLLIEMKEYNP